MHNSLWRLLAVMAAALLTLAACGDDGGTTGSTGTGVARVISITYVGGKVEGGGRVDVAKGSAVTLRVTADIEDEVHLHGYDKSVDTVVNKPVEIAFTANASGVFEVELEKKGLQLVEIEVK